MRPYNVGARGSNLTKLFHVTWGEAGMIIWIQLFGGQAPSPRIWEGKKVKNSTRFRRTSDFDRETDGDIENRKKQVINHNSSHARRQKLGLLTKSY